MPDEVVYQTWLGTYVAADGLNAKVPPAEGYTNEGDSGRDYDVGIVCTDDNYCSTVPALPPVIQNKINGVIYCGKRSPLSFSEMKRPVLNSNSKYECPEGTKPCNKEYLNEWKGGLEYVICIPESENVDEACPITSFAFDLDHVEDRS